MFQILNYDIARSDHEVDLRRASERLEYQRSHDRRANSKRLIEG